MSLSTKCKVLTEMCSLVLERLGWRLSYFVSVFLKRIGMGSKFGLPLTIFLPSSNSTNEDPVVGLVNKRECLTVKTHPEKTSRTIGDRTSQIV